MRGDQLSRQWWVNRAIEVSPNGLTVAKIARPDGAQGTAGKRSPSKACSKQLGWVFLLWGAEANSLSGTFLNGRA